MYRATYPRIRALSLVRGEYTTALYNRLAREKVAKAEPRRRAEERRGEEEREREREREEDAKVK